VYSLAVSGDRTCAKGWSSHWVVFLEGRIHGAGEYTGLQAILRAVSLDDLWERL